MKNIRAEGKCPVCGRFRAPKCPHGVFARQFFVDMKYQGIRILRGTDLDGRTLKTLDDAIALRQRLITEIQNRTFNLAKWTSKTKPDFLFQNLCEKWYQEKIREVEQKKLKPGYVVLLRQYIINYFHYFDNLDVRSIFNVKDFALWLPEKLSLGYQKNILTILSNFFHWCKNNRYISEIPVFPKISVPEHQFKALSLGTRLNILEYIPDEHKPIFTFLFYQGARPSEVRALKWDCIEGDTVIYKRTFSEAVLVETTKESNIRYNWIFPEVMKALPKRTFPLDFVFKHGKRIKKHYSGMYLRLIFYRALKAYNEKYGQNLKISLYEATKHSFGTSWRQQGMPLEMIKEWFGHKSSKITERYAKIDVIEAWKVMSLDKKSVKRDSKKGR
ncbi:MAG: site-specific integrase [Nitrospirae bacterium]|nr:site-specific integrase [Nitrospirota bacterium]